MSKELAVRLGKNIAAARRKAKKTQEEVAEKVGIETASLSRIERGIVMPSIPTVNKIANILNEPLPKFFEGTSSNTSDLAYNIASILEPFSEETRFFFFKQIKTWAEWLSTCGKKYKKTVK